MSTLILFLVLLRVSDKLHIPTALRGERIMLPIEYVAFCSGWKSVQKLRLSTKLGMLL